MTAKLVHLNKQLRAFHRRLLENERMEAEQELGQKINPFGFLQLLMNDARFAWLRPLSTFMADLDAFIDDAEETGVADLQRFKKQITELLEESRLAGRCLYFRDHDPEFALLFGNLLTALDAL